MHALAERAFFVTGTGGAEREAAADHRGLLQAGGDQAHRGQDLHV